MEVASIVPLIDVAHVGCGGEIELRPDPDFLRWFGGYGFIRVPPGGVDLLDHIEYTMRCRKCGLEGRRRSA